MNPLPPPPPAPTDTAEGAGTQADCLSADTRARLADRLAGLEYLRAEAERLLAEHPGPPAALISLTANALDQALQRAHALLDNTQP